MKLGSFISRNKEGVLERNIVKMNYSSAIPESDQLDICHTYNLTGL